MSHGLTPIQQRQIKTFKALADGTRMKMISVLNRPMTVKQLADLIGEDHHKLYHHMRVLEGAGIVRLVETRTDTHIVEKYYQLIENSMTLKSEEFTPEYIPMFNSMVLQIAQAAINDLVESAHPDRERAAASRVVLRCNADRFEAVRQAIQGQFRELLTSLQDLEQEEGESAYEILLLHFPVFEAADPAEEGQNGSAIRKRTAATNQTAATLQS
ncbi:MAG: hypothetical protein GEEBNDBF_00214 [bacterium]|nr:hypothetical protein [bacterium]